MVPSAGPAASPRDIHARRGSRPWHRCSSTRRPLAQTAVRSEPMTGRSPGARPRRRGSRPARGTSASSLGCTDPDSRRGAVTFSSASHPSLTIGRCGKRADKNVTATPRARSCQGGRSGPGAPGATLLRKSSAGAAPPRARSSHAEKDRAAVAASRAEKLDLASLLWMKGARHDPQT